MLSRAGMSRARPRGISSGLPAAAPWISASPGALRRHPQPVRSEPVRATRSVSGFREARHAVATFRVASGRTCPGARGTHSSPHDNSATERVTSQTPQTQTAAPDFLPGLVRVQGGARRPPTPGYARRCVCARRRGRTTRGCNTVPVIHAGQGRSLDGTAPRPPGVCPLLETGRNLYRRTPTGGWLGRRHVVVTRPARRSAKVTVALAL